MQEKGCKSGGGDLGAHKLEEEHLDVAVCDAVHASALRRCAVIGYHGKACGYRPALPSHGAQTACFPGDR